MEVDLLIVNSGKIRSEEINIGTNSPFQPKKRQIATEKLTACERVTPKKLSLRRTMSIPITLSTAPKIVPSKIWGKNKSQL